MTHVFVCMAQVGVWLQDIQLEQYKKIFFDKNIDGEKLLGLKDAYLSDTLLISSKLHRCFCVCVHVRLGTIFRA
jgi:hypothetical protein